ncbi:MAG: inositol monophosphatase [Alphaproteobacteria bacterium]|nr:inositol monophosphatase [Alphaproteobacteria bacterium]
MAVRSPIINVMEKACRKAARGLIRDFGEVEQLQVSKKGPADFVSNADLRAERILKDELGRARPTFGFLMEESGESGSAAGSATIEGRWIVDPLDGTLNFLHGVPHFCISVGLERQGEIVAGMILQPVTDEMFWAEKGAGAFVNGRRLRVSSRHVMAESMFATGIPFKGRGDHATFLKELSGVMAVSAGVRRFGAAALDLAYVAAGRFDGFWEARLNAWDIAAGLLLVREAGGFVSDLEGGQGMLASGDVVAATDKLHPQLLQVLRDARGQA